LEILFAFLLSTFAGLATGIGAIIVFFTRKTNTRLLAGVLGFSAGVMIYVAFVELLNEARKSLIIAQPEFGELIAISTFFAGILLIGVIDRLIPDYENPHEARKVEEVTDEKKAQNFRRLKRLGIFTALAIGIHNFPEGLASFVSALADPQLGISIAIAIAIHNIPEGIAVAIPIYYSTKSRKKALWYSFLSGLAEPLGAIFGYLLFRNLFGELFFGIIFALVAGIMVFISLDELLPAAQKYGHHHTAIYGVFSGMLIMAASLLLL
jgi:ZIP family zinc transporter